MQQQQQRQQHCKRTLCHQTMRLLLLRCWRILLCGTIMVMQDEDVNALSATSSSSTASTTTTTPTIPTTPLATSCGSGWSEIAIQAAETMTVNNRQRLQQSGVLGIQRPTRIRASRPLSSSTSSSAGTSSNGSNNQQQQGSTTTKLVHFQRHGQGYHNLLGDIWRELNMPINMDSADPKLNPFLRPEIRDAPLTDLGRQQCAERRTEILQGILISTHNS
jgi:hypothetical protein